ncbi:histidine phosphatase family protein [Candidatus Woesearchaeota archaeon]|nr:histidine phosphatase family protein [Candidatus Woesearchaeota archaeon]
MVEKLSDYLLTVYFLRHQESVQNKQGYGEFDTKLSKEGKRNADITSRLLTHIGVDNIDLLISGTLKRHKQTTQLITEKVNYEGEVLFDERIQALVHSPILENPPEQTMDKYDLHRFQRGEDSYCRVTLRDGTEVSFDPEASKVNPFDPLYSDAYFDRQIRKAVFPNNRTLPSFASIERKVRSFQRSMIERVDPLKTQNIVLVSSCGPAGVNLEYSIFGTVGENLFESFGSEDNQLFPIQHEEMMILGYTQQDLADKRKSLRPVEGNVGIETYLANETLH